MQPILTKDGWETVMRLEKLKIQGFRNFNDTEDDTLVVLPLFKPNYDFCGR